MSPSQNPGEYRVTDKFGHPLRRAYQRHTAIFQSEVSATKLSAAPFVMLCAVRDHQGATISDIVDAIAMGEPTVRGIVERFEWIDLVHVAHEIEDKRHATVTLSSLVQTAVTDTLPRAQHISELTSCDLNESEGQLLTGLLRRICGST